MDLAKTKKREDKEMDGSMDEQMEKVNWQTDREMDGKDG